MNIARFSAALISLAILIAVLSLSPTNNASTNSVEAAALGICDRSPQMRAAILARIPGVNDCSKVSDSHLNGVTALWLGKRGASSLKSNDLRGLSNLTELGLGNNKLKSLPSGLFDDLSNLQILYLGKNELSALPADSFDGLSSLKTLGLGNNSLKSLPSGLFDDLSSLQTLYLGGNNLKSLPNGLFDNTSGLQTLYLGNNELSALPADSFDGLSSLKTLSLGDNGLKSLPSGLFNDLYRLETLYLGNNEFTSTPDRMFVGLKSMKALWLGNNPGAPFTFTAELEQREDNIVAVKVAPGAPYGMKVTLSARGGVLGTSGNGATTATVTVPGGSVFSEEIIVTPDIGGDGSVTISVASAAFTYTSGGGMQTGLGESLTITQTVPEQVSKCVTQLRELDAASEWNGSWDDPKCRAYHRLDSPARYFRFKLSDTTNVSISLDGDGTLFVSKGTLNKKRFGTPPKRGMEQRIRSRLKSGKLLHNGGQSANLALPSGTYFVEAVSTGGKEFTLSVQPTR